MHATSAGGTMVIRLSLAGTKPADARQVINELKGALEEGRGPQR